MHDLNGALFLKVSFIFLLLASLVPLTLIVPVTAIYTLLLSHKSVLSTDVLNLKFLLTEY